jgi:hypothetical protein
LKEGGGELNKLGWAKYNNPNVKDITLRFTLIEEINM